MKIVTDILVAMFIVFIMLPFVLLCALIIIHEMIAIFRTVKKDIEELRRNEKR